MKCPYGCPKDHRIVSWDSLTEEEKKKKVKDLGTHRLMQEGYCGSLVKDTEILEIYGPLSIKRIIIQRAEEGEEEELDYEYYQQTDDEDIEAEE